MKENDVHVVFGFVIGVVIASVFWSLIIFTVINKSWEQEAVDRGYGEYNSYTGDWQWVEKTSEHKVNK